MKDKAASLKYIIIFAKFTAVYKLWIFKSYFRFFFVFAEPFSFLFNVVEQCLIFFSWYACKSLGSLYLLWHYAFPLFDSIR